MKRVFIPFCFQNLGVIWHLCGPSALILEASSLLRQVGSICERALSFTEVHVDFLALFVQGSENQQTLLHSFFVRWHSSCFLKTFFPYTYKGVLSVDSVFLISPWGSSVTFSLLALCVYISVCLFLWAAYLLYPLGRKELYSLLIEGVLYVWYKSHTAFSYSKS